MSTPLATIRANSTVDLHMHTTVSDGRSASA